MRNTRLLVVMEESKASKRAVSYVAQMIGRRKGFKVCLAYTLSELPASLIEYGGAKTPDEEEKLDAEFHAKQAHWVLAAKERARPALDRAYAILRKAGLTKGAIETRFCFPAAGRARADEILELASTHRFRTVVAGSKSISWLKQLLIGDPVEGLLRHAKGFTIWVVE